jgi:hypothetical protein
MPETRQLKPLVLFYNPSSVRHIMELLQNPSHVASSVNTTPFRPLHSHADDYDGDDGMGGYSSDSGSSYCTDASDMEALRARAKAIEESERLVAMAGLNRVCERTGIQKASHITHTADIATIRGESDRIENEVAVRRSIKFQRRALLTLSSGVEYMHNKSPMLKGRLTGWGECMLDSIDDFDVVFRRLHTKHGPKISNGRPSKEMEPEMELLYMVAYNAFTFTVSQSIANLTASAPEGVAQPRVDEAVMMMQARRDDAKMDSDRVRESTMFMDMTESNTTSKLGSKKTTTTKKGERVIQLS